MPLFICSKIWLNIEFRIGKYFTLEIWKYKTNFFFFFWLLVLCSEISQLCALIKAVLSLCWPSVDPFSLATPCPSVVLAWFFSSFILNPFRSALGPSRLVHLVYIVLSFDFHLFSFFSFSFFFFLLSRGVSKLYLPILLLKKEFKSLSEFQFWRAPSFPRFL